MNGPLENTIAANRRLNDIHTRLYVCSSYQFSVNEFFFV
jgi:hypothetical protein